MNAKSLFLAFVVALVAIAVPAGAQLLPTSFDFESGDLCGTAGDPCNGIVVTAGQSAAMQFHYYEGHYLILVSVQNNSDRQLLIPRNVVRASSLPSGGSGVFVAIKKPNGTVYSDGVLQPSLGSDPQQPGDTSSYFVVNPHQSRTFGLGGILHNDNETPGDYAFALTGLTFGWGGATAGTDIPLVRGWSSFQTPFVFVGERDQRIVVTLVDTDEQSPVGSNEALAHFSVKSLVENDGEDTFIEKQFCRGLGSTDCGVALVIESASGVYSGGVLAIQVSVIGPPAGDTPTHWYIDRLASKEFNVQIGLDNTGGTSGFYRACQKEFTHDDNGFDADGDIRVPLTDFCTNFVHVSNSNVSLTREARERRLLATLRYDVKTPGVETFIERDGVLVRIPKN